MPHYTVIGIDEGNLSDYSNVYEASWVEVVEADRPSKAAMEARRIRAEAAPEAADGEPDLEAQVVIAVFYGKLQDDYEPAADPLNRKPETTKALRKDGRS